MVYCSVIRSVRIFSIFCVSVSTTGVSAADAALVVVASVSGADSLAVSDGPWLPQPPISVSVASNAATNAICFVWCFFVLPSPCAIVCFIYYEARESNYKGQVLLSCTLGIEIPFVEAPPLDKRYCLWYPVRVPAAGRERERLLCVVGLRRRGQAHFLFGGKHYGMGHAWHCRNF